MTNDYPPKVGGIQVYLHELWRRLEPDRATVLTATSDPAAEAFDRDCGVVVERIPRATLFLPTMNARRAIEDAIDRHQPDLVLLDPAWPLGLLGPTLSRPYGVVLHGAEVTIPARLPLVASSLRHVLRHAEVAVCAGTYPEVEARRNAAEWMPPVIHVPPGVDTDRFQPLDGPARAAAREHFGLAEDAMVVSSYSRLVPRKGMDTLIRASVTLRESVPRLEVLIGGAGRDRDRLEALARKLDAPVRFWGRIPEDDLASWVAMSDVMVMACRRRWVGLEQEGFGIVFLEAAAAGVPQVAGRSGGSHEAVVDGVTGVVVERPRSASELARAMLEVLGDDERRAQFSLASRQHACEGFDWRHLAERLGAGLAPFDHATTSRRH